MAEFSIDNIISGFEGKSASKAKTGALDIDSLLSGFKTSEPVVQVAPKKIISTEPKPPISGISKESSDELNQTRVAKEGGKNPRRMLPTTNILEKIGENYEAGKDLLGEAATDVQTGHPYKGLGKGALGILSVVTSPGTGLAEGGVGTLAADITGNKSFGDRAALITGAAIPVAPGAGLVVKNLPKNKMFRQLVEDIGPENLSTVVQEMKSNPRLNPADLSPKVLQSTQELFAGGGPVNYLKKTSDARMAGAADAVETAYDTATGIPVNAVTKLKELEAAAKNVGKNEINPAIASAKPVNVTPVIEHIDGMLKPGVNSKISNETLLTDPEIKKKLAVVKQYLTDGKNQRTGAEDLHNIQSAFRAAAQNLLNSADGGARQAGYALMQVRNKLVDAIDTAADGKYKPALSRYKDEKDINDAFNYGYESVFTKSKKLEYRPEFTEKWFNSLTEAEKSAAREGARLQLDTQINNFRFAARRGQEIPEAEFNKQKLELIFGKAETDKLVKALQDERKIANTHNKVIEGTQTAMRDVSKSEWKAPESTKVGQGLLMGAGIETANILAHGYPGVGGAMLATAKVGGYGKDIIKNKIHAEKQAQYAKYALPTEGPSRDELIQALEAAIPKPKLSLMSRARLALPTP